jgi:hypothetical protein
MAELTAWQKRRGLATPPPQPKKKAKKTGKKAE